MRSYVNLHAHSHYSLLDGLAKPFDYIDRAIELNQPAACVTDHGNIHSWLEFYDACKNDKKGDPRPQPIQPILGCLLKGQPIITSNGMKVVEEIAEGDIVLTHKGRYRKVTSTMKHRYAGTFYEIHLADSNHTLTLTEDHPILVQTQVGLDWRTPGSIPVGTYTLQSLPNEPLLRKNRRRKQNRYRSYVCMPKLEESSFEINVCDYMPPDLGDKGGYIGRLSKRHSRDNIVDWKNIPNRITLTEDFAYFLGLYTAEGSCSYKKNFMTGGIQLTFHLNEIGYRDWVSEFVKSEFDLDSFVYLRPEKTIGDVAFNCVPLAYLLDGICGRGAANKRVPLEIMQSSKFIKAAFLRGLLDGDGKHTASDKSLKMASPHVVWAAKALLADQGYWAHVGSGVQTSKRNGKTYKDPYWYVHAGFEELYRRSQEDVYGTYKGIRSIRAYKKEEWVYNFEVEEDNSYVSNFILHNCEAYQARKTRFDRDDEERAGKANDELTQRGPYHLTLLARNLTGYKNLIKLSSEAYLEGFYVKPRIDHELLAQHAEGITVLSGCLNGEVQQALLRNDYEFARNAAARLQDIVGPEFFFMELQDHGLPEQKHVLKDIIEIAKELGAPIVPTGDTHYVRKEHAHMHDLLLCVSTNATVDQENRFRFFGPEFYLKSYEEMEQIFPLEWLDNTLLASSQVELELQFGELHFPEYPLPPGDTADEMLEREVYVGLQARYGEPLRQDVIDRATHELRVVKKMGFSHYFLVVADLLRFARENGVRTGWGRGSAAGSILSYALSVTNLDPIHFGLLFERFLVEGRKSMPDIDIDLDDRFRDQVIAYAKEKYGRDQVAHIATFNVIGARQAIRDAARVLGYDYTTGDKLAKSVPPPVLGIAKTIEESLKTNELRNEYEASDAAKAIIDGARGLEGVVRQTGIHAAGLVIAKSNITDYVPVMRKGEDAPVVTQWSMDQVDKCGQLKIDFLGLRNLGVIEMCLQNVFERTGEKINVYSLPMDDPETFAGLCRGESVGVFQLEGAGITEMTVSLQPNCVEDVMAIIALYRPGPLGSGTDKKYISCKHGRSKVRYDHPKLRDVLRGTYGIMLYQEDVLAVSRVLAGFSPAEADDLRKIVGKKLMDKIDLFRERFIEGCHKTHKVDKSIANKIYNDIAFFAGYGFGKCIAGDTLVETTDGYLSVDDIRQALALGQSVFLSSCDVESHAKVVDECVEVIDEGIQPVFEVEFEDGTKITATLNHKFLCSDDNEYHTVSEIMTYGLDVVTIDSHS